MHVQSTTNHVEPSWSPPQSGPEPSLSVWSHFSPVLPSFDPLVDGYPPSVSWAESSSSARFWAQTQDLSRTSLDEQGPKLEPDPRLRTTRMCEVLLAVCLFDLWEEDCTNPLTYTPLKLLGACQYLDPRFFRQNHSLFDNVAISETAMEKRFPNIAFHQRSLALILTQIYFARISDRLHTATAKSTSQTCTLTCWRSTRSTTKTWWNCRGLN